jgi:hypothetical protein
MVQTYSDADKSHVVKGSIASFGIIFKEGATESFLSHKNIAQSLTPIYFQIRFYIIQLYFAC